MLIRRWAARVIYTARISDRGISLAVWKKLRQFGALSQQTMCAPYKFELSRDSLEYEAQAPWRREIVPLPHFFGCGILAMLTDELDPGSFNVAVVHDIVNVACGS